MVKKVAVIGAGVSGLTAIKCCLDEGLEPVGFELTGRIGGLWYYDEDIKDEVASVMKSTTINTSKEMMCYSDFPMPGNFPNFMHNTQVLEYLNLYADNFGLKKHIRFNTKVTKVRPAEDFQETGRWQVEYQENRQSSSQIEVFDAVLLCTGHHTSKNLPSFPGQNLFKGTQLHTHDYRNGKGFEGKRVVVVGVGNSACDVAVELSKISKQVFLSTRRGAWVVCRSSDKGVPLDFEHQRRSSSALKKITPTKIRNYLIQSKLNQRFDHKAYGLQPKHGLEAEQSTVNDDLPDCLASGTIIIKPNVSKITTTSVEFDDGTSEDDIDVIIYATGYKFGFPFVDHPAFEVKNNKPHLYKYVFAPDIPHQTIAAIGFIQPNGATMPISEVQSRWAARVFKGLSKLPSKELMNKDILLKARVMSERYVVSPRYTIQVDVISFMDEVAAMIGCQPNILAFLLRDPMLAFEVYFGPCTPYQYRLCGPGTWSGARQAIMTQRNRVEQVIKKRPIPASKTEINFVNVIITFIITSVLFRYVFFSVLSF